MAEFRFQAGSLHVAQSAVNPGSASFHACGDTEIEVKSFDGERSRGPFKTLSLKGSDGEELHLFLSPEEAEEIIKKLQESLSSGSPSWLARRAKRIGASS
jgi:hypothetical protein